MIDKLKKVYKLKDDWINLAPAGSGPALCQIELVPGSRVPLGSNGRRATGQLHMQVAHDSLDPPIGHAVFVAVWLVDQSR
jgi:hypothetical protein